MKIAHYCQHILGIGHIHRSLEIARVLGRRHEVTMIVGGRALPAAAPEINLFALPGLEMDPSFSGLVPCEPGGDLDAVKAERTRRLLDFFASCRPERLLVELYPFGRKAFRFELDPLLEQTRRTGCRTLCSVRDILVEKKQDQRRHEERAAKVLNRYFDAVLVHADPDLVRLEETFGLADRLRIPVHYTGFVTPQPASGARAAHRRELGLGDRDRLVVASIGGGGVGAELLDGVLAARPALDPGSRFHFQLFAGPYMAESRFQALARQQDDTVTVNRFTDRFVDWLAAADLSVSMAGYNTCMNVLAAGVPALMLPFGQNREQRLRIEKLAGFGPLRLLGPDDLTPRALAASIADYAARPRYTARLDLNGADRTRTLIEARG